MKIRITPLGMALAVLTVSLCLFMGESVVFDLAMRAGAHQRGVSADRLVGNPALRVNFGIPIAAQGFGLDFKVHDYIARNFGPSVAAYSAAVPYQPEPYSSPPLLPLFFSWVKLFRLDTAQAIWLFTILLGILGLGIFWFKEAQKAAPKANPDFTGPAQFAVAALFMLSYPVMFSFERGASDFPVLALYSLGALFLRRRQWLGLGAVSALAALLKVYPLFPGLALSLAALFLILKKQRAGFLILGGQALAATVAILPFLNIYRHYVTKVVWNIHQLGMIAPNSHSLPYFYAKAGWIAWGILLLTGTASLVSRLSAFADSREKNGKESFYGVLFAYTYLLGISTYISPAGYDYSLILWIPLFALCVSSIPSRRVFFYNAGLFFLLAGYAAPRWLHLAFLLPPSFAGVYTIVQTAGLAFLAMASFIPA